MVNGVADGCSDGLIHPKAPDTEGMPDQLRSRMQTVYDMYLARV